MDELNANPCTLLNEQGTKTNKNCIIIIANHTTSTYANCLNEIPYI